MHIFKMCHVFGQVGPGFTYRLRVSSICLTWDFLLLTSVPLHILSFSFKLAKPDSNFGGFFLGGGWRCFGFFFFIMNARTQAGGLSVNSCWPLMNYFAFYASFFSSNTD